MADEIGKIGDSLVQHGKFNDRIYLMKLAPGDYPVILTRLDELAARNGYSKIFAKVPSVFSRGFEADGYQLEAEIPRFYHGEQGASFLGKYYSLGRRQDTSETVQVVLKAAEAKSGTGAPPILPSGFKWRIALPEDTMEMAKLYRAVFPTYPFPIHDGNYLRKTMAENVAYFGVWHSGNLVALASAEQDMEALNVEMTDFATLPSYNGHGFAAFLLAQMEAAMAAKGHFTAYTIARALSFGMNITFAKAGYEFAGTLVKNTNISGGLESMNVWYKSL